MISAYTVLKRYGLASVLALAVFMLVPFAAGMSQWVAQDTTYTVTTLIDELDGDLLPATNAGAGTSLREAVKYSLSGDQIVFQAGLTGTIFLSSDMGELAVSHYLTINGPGVETIEVNGNDLSRIFSVGAGDSLDLNDLTLASGRATGLLGTGVDGAAIYSEGWVTLTNTVIRWSTAIRSGGAIYHDGDELILNNCRIERCEAYRDGGAIAVLGGSVVISDGIFEGNTARYDGGALYLGNSDVNGISGSTFSENTAIGNGGAISVLAASTLNLAASTLNDNSARNGAGIDNAGTLVLVNSTISGNSAGNGGGGIRSSGTAASNFATIAFNNAEQGGGVLTTGSFGPHNTIFSSNAASNGPDVMGTVTSAGYNLVEDLASSSGWVVNDTLGSFAQPRSAALDALHFNGGITKTHALLECSDAVDAGDASGAPAADQRGLTRTVNGDYFVGAVPDIGAFEAQGILDLTPVEIITYQNPDTLKIYLGSDGLQRIFFQTLGFPQMSCGVRDTTVTPSVVYCSDVAPNGLGGPKTITLTAWDNKNKMVTKSVVVLVVDNTAPVFDDPAPADVVAFVSTGCTTTLTNTQLVYPAVTENCTVTITNDNPGTFGIGITKVTWTATDASGNKATRAQFVTVSDTTRPTITAPAAVVAYTTDNKCSVPASMVTLGTPTANDNCSVTVTNNAPAQYGKLTTVIWTATDPSGNVSSAAQTVTVIDNTPPTINAPADLTLVSDVGSCDRNGATVLLGTPAGYDNCGGVTFTNNKPAVFLGGPNYVTWTVTDEQGLQATAIQTVTIFDGNPPTVVAPPELEVMADAGTCAWVVVPSILGSATSTDNCGVPTATNSAGTSLSVGMHRIIWTATDGFGNQTTDVQLVTVVGDPPVIACVSDFTVNTDPGKAGAVVTYTLPTATSGCSAFELLRTSGPGSGDFFPVGTTNVGYMAIDGSNQIAMCDFDVTVVDNEAPQISVSVAPRNLWPADNNMKAIEATVVVKDNVPGAVAVLTSVTCNQNAIGDTAGIILGWLDLNYEFRAERTSGPREYTVLYTATDVAGNWSTGQAIVTVPTVKPKDVEGEELPIPLSVSLAQNYPNPFNPSTLISFGTPVEQHIELQIFNAMGMPVRTLISSQVGAGSYTVEWDGNDNNGRPVSTGVYLYMLRGGDVHLERKMILAR